MVLLDELETVGFLDPFSPRCRKQLAALALLHEYEPDDLIFRQGRSERSIYLVLRGEVNLEVCVPDSGVLSVFRVGPGELLGWSPVLGHRAMTASARALTPCRLIALDAAQIRALAEQDPRFGLEFFRGMSEALADRLRATRLQLPLAHRHQMMSVQEGAD